MFGDITLSEPLIYVLVPVLIAGAFSLIAFLFSQKRKSDEAMATVATNMAVVTTKIEALEHRVQRIEGFQDGVQFGRATSDPRI